MPPCIYYEEKDIFLPGAKINFDVDLMPDKQ